MFNLLKLTSLGLTICFQLLLLLYQTFKFVRKHVDLGFFVLQLVEAELDVAYCDLKTVLFLRHLGIATFRDRDFFF